MSSSAVVLDLNFGSNVMFPSNSMRLLSAVTQFLGVSILTHCLSRRLACEELSSLRGWKDLTWPRLCLLLVFLDSWLFLFTCGVLIFGVGLEHGITECSLSIYLCIAFYGTSKLFIYCFLIEKVRVVWAPTSNANRWRSPVYIICVVTVALYGVVTALMFYGRMHYLRQDGTCVTGVHLFASVPLLSYDLYVSVFLTSMFLWPLLRTGQIDPMVRRVAQRTLIAAIVTLATSTANVLVLTLLHGRELGWVCLGSCGSDVICNAVGLFWVTDRATPHSSSNMKIGTNPGAIQDISGISKPHSMIIENQIESFPSFQDMSAEERGHRYEMTRKGASISLENRSVPQQSLVRIQSASQSRSPWSMESVAGFFGKGEPTQEDQQELRVKVTTQREVVEDVGHRVEHTPYSRPSTRDLKSPDPGNDSAR